MGTDSDTKGLLIYLLDIVVLTLSTPPAVGALLVTTGLSFRAGFEIEFALRHQGTGKPVDDQNYCSAR